MAAPSNALSVFASPPEMFTWRAYFPPTSPSPSGSANLTAQLTTAEFVEQLWQVWLKFSHRRDAWIPERGNCFGTRMAAVSAGKPSCCVASGDQDSLAVGR